jgi:hypothetical protein
LPPHRTSLWNEIPGKWNELPGKRVTLVSALNDIRIWAWTTSHTWSVVFSNELSLMSHASSIIHLLATKRGISLSHPGFFRWLRKLPGMPGRLHRRFAFLRVFLTFSCSPPGRSPSQAGQNSGCHRLLGSSARRVGTTLLPSGGSPLTPPQRESLLQATTNHV